MPPAGRSRPNLTCTHLPRPARFAASGGRKQAQCLGIKNFPDLASLPSDRPATFTDQLRLAVPAYLARFRAPSREHTASNLRCYLAWCAQRGLDPLAARRPHLELYMRWMQEVRVTPRYPVTTRDDPLMPLTDNLCATAHATGIAIKSPRVGVRRACER
jgi:hypothetical protein